jgi:predicted DsbA family dithiol-disulfide isomerase
LVDEAFVIDLWSDVVCPFCCLGSRQLCLALEQFEHRDLVVVRPRAFELDPRPHEESGLSLSELVARKYAMDLGQVHSLHERLEAQAAGLGMTWSLERARPTNTFEAHRLISLARTQGRGEAMSERLFRAYFCEGLFVGDHETLAQLASEVGVSGVELLLASDDFSDDVRDDEESATELGITGVPSMLLDGKFMVVGAQGTQQFLDVLRRAWARREAA